VEDLEIDANVLALPVAQAPADGVVATGEPVLIDVSIAGKSVSIEKLPGSCIFAGILNRPGMRGIWACLRCDIFTAGDRARTKLLFAN
jgi:cation transport ATPase